MFNTEPKKQMNTVNKYSIHSISEVDSTLSLSIGKPPKDIERSAKQIQME